MVAENEKIFIIEKFFILWFSPMPRPKQEEDLRLLTKVSKLYYEENLTQDEIMERLQLSRSKVSRLLQRARERGIVKITVMSPPGLYPDLEAELENRYQLSEALVVEARDPQSQALVSRELGIAAANYLLRTLQDNDVIGISWGTTLSYMVAALQPRPTPGATWFKSLEGLGHPNRKCTLRICVGAWLNFFSVA